MDAYVDRVEANLARLERFEIATRQDISMTQQQLVRSTASIEIELAALKEELVSLEHELYGTVERARGIILKFKTAVKQGDLQRVQRRADAWAPEKRITRDQFKRLLAQDL